ncbi:hypothetical protein pb186bvf_017557 [Paramecium bursaria]
MNYGRQAGLGGSRSSQLGSSSQKSQKGFWGLLRRAYVKLNFLYRKSRTLIWFGSTGLIFLVAPFAFSHFLEVNEELQRLAMSGASIK